MNRIVSLRPALLIAAMASLLPAMPLNVRAADLDDAIAAEAGITPVEYGSGWYLRGDIGTLHGSGTSFYPNGGSSSLYGPSFGETVSPSVGIGYIFNDRLRADFTISHSDGFGLDGVSSTAPCGSTYTGDCYFEDSGALAFTKFEASAYLNLGDRNGFNPYVGAGLGIARVQWSDYSSRQFCILDPTETCDGATHSGGPGQEIWYSTTPGTAHGPSMMLAASVMAGMDYKISDYWTVDFGYKYSRLIDVGWNSGDDGAEVEGIDMHELRVGLRYEIW